MKKILIINGHPNKESFNFALAEAYKKGAVPHTSSPHSISRDGITGSCSVNPV